MLADGRLVLEGIVTTIDADSGSAEAPDRVNISPMGPLVDETLETLVLRPFTSSRTYRNLKAHGEGVFHVIDDVELLAHAAVSKISAPMDPATAVRGFRLRDACRAYEFRVSSLDDSHERTTIEARVVHVERLRDFFGFHRARHAVVEAAILATRTEFLPIDDILCQLDELQVLVDKTGGEKEHRAFSFLREHVEAARSSGESEDLER
jgi:hypothetical protein